MKIKTVMMLLFVFAYVMFGTNSYAKGINAINNTTTAMQMTLTNTVFFYAGSQDIDEELCNADKNYSVTIQQQFDYMMYGTPIENEDFKLKFGILLGMIALVILSCVFNVYYNNQEEFDSYR
jgi:hypothetical protein